MLYHILVVTKFGQDYIIKLIKSNAKKGKVDT